MVHTKYAFLGEHRFEYAYYWYVVICDETEQSYKI